MIETIFGESLYDFTFQSATRGHSGFLFPFYVQSLTDDWSDKTSIKFMNHVVGKIHFFYFCRRFVFLSLFSFQQIKRSSWNRRPNLDVLSSAWCSNSSCCCYWDWPESPPPADLPTCVRKPCACRSTSPWTTAYPGPKSRRAWSDSWCKTCRRRRRSFLNPHKHPRTKLSSASIGFQSCRFSTPTCKSWDFFFSFNMLKIMNFIKMGDPASPHPVWGAGRWRVCTDRRRGDGQMC